MKLFTLTNANGMKVDITNYGARIVRLVFDGRDVVQGFNRLEDYLPENHQNDFGAVIGRYANRLKNGRITIGGKTIQLPVNNGPNCLHGGFRGWQYSEYEVEKYDTTRLTLSMTSPDGDNSFPGTIHVQVVYELSDDNALKIHYHAVTDSDTVINMTNHSYFNLSGNPGSSIENHNLWIDASRYTPVDEHSIPLGWHDSVEGTPMNFRLMKAVGRDIHANFQQLKIGNGYDHNCVLDTRGDLASPCAKLESDKSGIGMEVYTTQPGMQVYTGNFLDGVIGKNGIPYTFRSAICLETQQYPDSPNNRWPESTGRLKANETFEATTIYKFYRIS